MTDPRLARRVRLRDVAEVAGVNPSIASRILNDDPTLSARPETRMRVRDAAREMGYTPNAFARGLKLQRTNTLGLVLPNVADPINAQLVQSAERRAAHDGYVVLLADLGDFISSGDVYRRLILERRVDGLIVSGAAEDALVEDLGSHRIPCVLVNRRSRAGAPCVSANDAVGVTLALDHLAALGRRRVGFIDGPPVSDDGGARARQQRAAFRAHGIDPRRVTAGLTEEAAFNAVAVLLEDDHELTALVVASVSQGVGALAAIRRAGLTAPADLSLVSLDDSPLTAYLDPPLTAVRMPLREVAETAVDQLLRIIRGEAGRDVIVPTQPVLIVRDSTAPWGGEER